MFLFYKTGYLQIQIPLPMPSVRIYNVTGYLQRDRYNRYLLYIQNSRDLSPSEQSSAFAAQ